MTQAVVSTPAGRAPLRVTGGVALRPSVRHSRLPRRVTRLIIAESNHRSLPLRSPADNEFPGGEEMAEKARTFQRVTATDGVFAGGDASSVEHLVAADRSLRDVLAMAAHDLRTPLLTIATYADLIESLDLPREKVAEMSGVIGRQARGLDALIADLVALSQLGGGDNRGEPGLVPLAAAAREAAESAGLGSELSIQVPADLQAWADLNHVHRILTNYLVNARRHAGGRITVTARKVGDRVHIGVIDTGPGVSEELVPRLFDRFTRGATAGDHTGQGLGLAIATRLARLNGGAVWYEPNPPNGARFWVSLPADERAAGL